MEFQIDDFINLYPEITDNIQEEITAKSEFSELIQDKWGVMDKGDTYYYHQKMFKRYLMQYPHVLNISEPGSGKTGSVAALTEELLAHKCMSREEKMKQIRDDYLPRSENIDKVIVLTGEAQGENFKHQIINKFSNGRFTGEDRVPFIRDYEIKSYVSFASHIHKKYFEKKEKNYIEKIRKDFRGVAFVVDEIHKISIKIQSEVKQEDNNTISTFKQTYEVLWNLFHINKENIRIIMTATPIVQNRTELLYHLNLILPLETQLYTEFMNQIVENSRLRLDVSWSKIKIFEAGDNEVNELLSGRIIYVSAPQTEAKISFEEVYFKKNGKTIICPPEDPRPIDIGDRIREIELKGIQKEVTSNLAFQTVPREEITAYQKPRQASILVYPDGSIGNAGFAKYVTLEAGKEIPSTKRTDKKGNEKTSYEILDKIYEPTEEFKEVLEDAELLEQHSNKIYYTVKRCIELDYKDFVYSEFLSPIYVTGLALELGLGDEKGKFQRFSPGNYKLNKREMSELSNGKKYVCQKRTDLKAIAKIEKRKRYAIITAKTPKQDRENIFEIYNHEDNVRGDYIKVIILSEALKEGISLYDVTKIFMLTSGWNYSSLKQAVFRALRAVSHTNLSKILGEKTWVEILYLVSVNNEEGANIDLAIFGLIINKFKEDAKIISQLKKISVDCQINHNINTNINFKDNSPECDFDKCERICHGKKAKESDIGTYESYYLKDITKKYTPDIKKYFFDEDNVSGTIYDILNYLNNNDQAPEVRLHEAYEVPLGSNKYKRFYAQTLYYHIINKTVFLNRLGYPFSIKENNNIYFRSNNIYSTIEPKPDVSYYAKQTYVYNPKYMKIKLKRKEDIGEILIEDIGKLSLHNKSLLLEKVIRGENRKGESKYSKEVKKYFKSTYIELYKNQTYVKLLDDLTRAYQTGTMKIINASEKEVLRLLLDTLKTEADPIYIHYLSLFDLEKNTTGDNYHSSAKIKKMEGLIRMFDTSYGHEKWRDATKYENFIFRNLLSRKVNKIYEDMEKKIEKDFKTSRIPKIYAIFYDNNYFLLPTFYDKENLTKETEKRQGRKFISFNKFALAHICFLLKVYINSEDYKGDDIVEDIKKLNKGKNLIEMDTLNHTINIDQYYKDSYTLNNCDSDQELIYYILILKNKKIDFLDLILSKLKEHDRIIKFAP